MGRSPPKQLSLYCSEDQIAEEVLGPGHQRDWRDKAAILERQGLPRIDPVMGGRYLPAVRAFFDRLNGLSERHVPTVPDGPENFECLTPKKTKSSTSPRETPQGSRGAPAKEASVYQFGSPPKKP